LIGTFILYCKIVAPKVKQELIDQIPIYAMVWTWTKIFC